MKLTPAQMENMWNETIEDVPDWKILEREFELCKLLDEFRRKLFWTSVETKEILERMEKANGHNL